MKGKNNMTPQKLREQDVYDHQEKINHNIERQQRVALNERERSIDKANQNSAIARVVNIVYFLFGIVEVLLAVRIILHLIGANPTNSFANFIDTVSWPFVAMFSTLVQNPTVGDFSILEVTTLIAMLIWGIAAWLVGQLIWLALSRPR
jgi:uncharacterized protein YggT (Ycf19 family)